MHARTVRKRITRLEQLVNRAAEWCRRDTSVPEALRQAVRAFDEQCEHVSRALQGVEEPARLRRCVDDLEAIAARAAEACAQAEGVEEAEGAEELSERIVAPLRKAHRELQKLQRQLGSDVAT